MPNRIADCYEGLESASIVITGGHVRLTASDDGVNVVDGEDASGAAILAQQLLISGGYLYIDADGDGLDVNASIVMDLGTVIIDGPESQYNGAIDYDGTFAINGGLLIAAGRAGMAQAPGTLSTQLSLMLGATAFVGGRPGPLSDDVRTFAAGTIVRVETAAGADLLTFAPSKSWQTVLFSGPELTLGQYCTVLTGGSDAGAVSDGLYTSENYTGGVVSGALTVQGVVTEMLFN